MTARELASAIEKQVVEIREAQSEAVENGAVDDLATLVLENWAMLVIWLREVDEA